MEETPPQLKSRIPNWLKTTLTIIVSAGILYYYLHDQDWKMLLESFTAAYMPLAVSAIIMPQLLFWYLDALMTQRTVLWFHGEVPLRDIFFIKGASYVLGLINNAVAKGGIFIYLIRKVDISLTKLLGIQLFRMGLGLWGAMVYIAILAAAAQYLDLGIEKHFNMTIFWICILVNIYWLIEAWLFWHHDVNIGISRLIVNKEKEFWSSWVESKPVHWFLIWAWTIPAFVVAFLSYYLVALSFGIKIPFATFMVLIPFVLLLSNLPISFASYGTTTAAWMFFFEDYATGAQIATLTLFIPTARLIIRATIGAGMLPFAMKDITNLPEKEV